MTIETRSASSSAVKSHQELSKMTRTHHETSSTASSNGYQADLASEEDGFYTSAVSVQHKILTTEQHEMSSELSSSESEQMVGRKVVWPAWNVHTTKTGSTSEEIHHHHLEQMVNQKNQSKNQVDRPLAWIREKAAEHEIQKRAEQMEMEIQKRTFDITKSNRMSRSRSRSNQIMERARSFDRLAAEVSRSNPNSRPPSRARGRRSPSLNRQLAEFWQQGSTSRPESRGPEFEPPKRWQSVGKIDVTQWESRIRDASPQASKLGHTPRIRLHSTSGVPNSEEQIKKSEFPRGHVNVQWPPVQQQHEATPPPPPPPPPPAVMTSSDWSSESVRLLCDEENNKEQIVQEWVRQTSNHQQEMSDEDLELQKFAYDIAETLVTSMEQSAGIQTKNTFSGIARAVPAEARLDDEDEEEIKRRENTESKKREVEQRKRTQEEKRRREEEQRKRKELMERQKREDEERKKFEEEKRKREEEQRKRKELMERQKREDEERKKFEEEKRKREEEQRKRKELMERQKREDEERKKFEEEKRKREEEQMKRKELMERQEREEEERKKFAEEKRKREEEQMKRQKEEKRKREEEIKRVRQEEERKIKEEHRKLEEKRKQEEKRKKQEKKSNEEKRIRFSEQQVEEPLNRSMTPKFGRKLSFDVVDNKVCRSRDFSTVKTGIVEEKRNFWIRSTSMDKLNSRHEMSPWPRRRFIQQHEWIRTTDTGETSRPGSSLGQVGADQGNVKQAVSSFSQLSKSRSSAAVLQEFPQKMSKSGNLKSAWIVGNAHKNDFQGEPEIENRKLLSHHDVRTNQVHDTINELTRRTGDSGRTTPALGETRRPAVHLSDWRQEHLDESEKGLRYDDVHTHQVQETVQEYAKKTGDSGRNTPLPSRPSGEANLQKSVVTDETSKTVGSTPWRTSSRTQEPSLKLVNVTVEKSATGGANVRISENAQAQMAAFMQQETRKESKTVSQTLTSSTVKTTEQKISETRVEPTKEPKLTQVPPRSPGPTRSTKTSAHKDRGKLGEGEIPRTDSRKTSKHVVIEEIASPETEDSKSNLSSCSRQIPMPVSQSWFEHQEFQHQQKQFTSVTSSCQSTPLPVLAGWFEEEKKKESENFQQHQTTKEEKYSQSFQSEVQVKKQLELEQEREVLARQERSSLNEEHHINTQDNDSQSFSHDIDKADEVARGEEDVATAMKGKVRDNIALFKQPQAAKSPSGSNLASEVESLVKGKVGESRKAYVERSSLVDREDTEKQCRARELEEMLRARNESGSQPVDPERLFAQRQREERERELEEVARMRATTIAHNLWEETDAHERAIETRQQRAKELEELASKKLKKDWNLVVASGGQPTSDEFFDDYHETEQEKRAKELQEIVSSRQKKNWDEIEAENDQHQRAPSKVSADPELDLDEARKSIRSAAMAWQERERAARADSQDQKGSTTPTPSRRIANLFNKNSDHWQMQDHDDEFPAPPEDIALPPPPPRDSSKEFMMEFASGRSKRI